MAKVIYSAKALADIDRFIEFLLQPSPNSAVPTIEAIQTAGTIFERHPLIGRRVGEVRRELVISRGASGYLALYRYEVSIGVVRLLRLRHQREAGYRD